MNDQMNQSIHKMEWNLTSVLPSSQVLLGNGEVCRLERCRDLLVFVESH